MYSVAPTCLQRFASLSFLSPISSYSDEKLIFVLILRKEQMALIKVLLRSEMKM